MNTSIRRFALSMLSCCVACAAEDPGRFTTGGGDTVAAPGRTYRWTFDDAAPGEVPAELDVSLGDWLAAADGASPSAPNVLRQTGAFSNPSFPRALVRNLVFQDLTVSVECRLDSGDTDRACGLMFRAQDSDNYYVTRANALENNVRLYHVVGGNRVQFAGANLAVTAGEWHTLEATATGDHLIVRWDGATVIDAYDGTFASAGKIGLWTKADSVTAFDELLATAE